MPLETPVAFFVFNRPATTERVFAAISAVKPRRLLVIGDGPRRDHPHDPALVAQTREVVARVNWPCDVTVSYSGSNLGCKRRIASGLKWVFQSVSEAIILEDDCLPDPSFFSFCQQLLDRYRADRRVTSVSGSNFQDGQSRSEHSYYFSKYFHCWGWASWRRVWQQFDPDMLAWPRFSAAGCLQHIADSWEEQRYWQTIYDSQYGGNLSSWAYPWQFSCWSQSGLSALPNVNLVSNIGFGDAATHTGNSDTHLANAPTSSIQSLKHPPFLIRNKEADQYTFEHVYQRPRGLRKFYWKINRYLAGVESRAG